MTKVAALAPVAAARATNESSLSPSVSNNDNKLDDETRRWLTTPAHELSVMIKDGRLSCAKLCQLYIERIKQVQPSINGMAQDRFEAAQREAQELDELLIRFKQDSEGAATQSGDSKQVLTQEQVEMLQSPLFGVPVSVKESIGIKGMRNSAGAWEYRDRVAEEDAVVVKNVKRHGMIPICTTNIPELTLFWADCHNPVYGRSRNPYNLGRITGASSGGEAALLAAGASLCGLGSDIGGSLRNPAHYCGIMSHKPSPYLVSSEGNFPSVKESRLRMFTLGPMCRYASDLRFLLKLMLSDRDNPRQDSYKTYQPDGIGEHRVKVMRQLENANEFSNNLSRVKILHCNYKQMNRLWALIVQREFKVQQEIMEAQQEVLDHFVSKFNCQLQEIDLDKYMDKIFVTWMGMISCAGTVDRDETFEPDEIAKLYGIKSMLPEVIKYMLGMSKRTKESLLTIMFGLPIPNNRQRAYEMCEKLEKLASEMKNELELAMGDLGCVIMPTLPTVAHKHHYALLKTYETRFPCLWNVCQMPVTHVTIRRDKKQGLPYGMSIASRPFNDALTITMAEEVERSLGGWTPPPKFFPTMVQ